MVPLEKTLRGCFAPLFPQLPIRFYSSYLLPTENVQKYEIISTYQSILLFYSLMSLDINACVIKSRPFDQ